MLFSGLSARAVQMKLSKKDNFSFLLLRAAAPLQVAQRKKEKVCGRHSTPLFNRQPKKRWEQNRKSKKSLSVEHKKVRINKFTFFSWKITPFSKLWDFVIWSKEVAKIIALESTNAAKFLPKKTQHRIYDLQESSPGRIYFVDTEKKRKISFSHTLIMKTSLLNFRRENGAFTHKKMEKSRICIIN